jgi:hypothetical protein
MSFAVELTGLLRSMPCLFAPAGERADWYDRKAALLDRVVAESPTCDRVEVAGLAEAARLRAAALRQGWS